ncbi:hypothetical protein [uncultured Tateyamaria sp.]|uniref:hypothetical protein n=1 Tax=uncultured Tateyamaria sp. TaxID=455651 RepID=UPI00261254D2|nr:hypothetical protein [uncultured Tateyamaria sp.]
MATKGEPQDPKGLIFEAYRIEGITQPECRTIFLDWALSLPDATSHAAAIAHLLDRYGPDHNDHPMTQVLREGRDGMATPRRRGGWRGRSRAH